MGREGASCSRVSLSSPHTWFRPAAAGGGDGAGSEVMGGDSCFSAPLAAWRHAPGPAPPEPGSGSARGSGGRGGAERPKSSGLAAGRGPGPGPAARGGQGPGECRAAAARVFDLEARIGGLPCRGTGLRVSCGGGAKAGVEEAGTSLGVVESLQETEWERDDEGES